MYCIVLVVKLIVTKGTSMLKVFVLTVVMYYNGGYSGTMVSNQYYYPSNESCVFAAGQWLRKYKPKENPNTSQLTIRTVNCEVAYLPK